MNGFLPPMLMLHPAVIPSSREANQVGIALNPLQSSTTQNSSSATGTSSIVASTLQDIICNNTQLYFFFVMTGIIFPITNEQKLRPWYWLMGIYVVLLHLVLVCTFVVYIFAGSNGNKAWFEVSIAVIVPLQMICIYAAMIYVRREMTQVRSFAIAHYEKAFLSAAKSGQVLIIVLVASSIINVSLAPKGDLVPLIATTCLPLYGTSTLLVGDQRVARALLVDLQQQLDNQKLTKSSYLAVRNFLNYESSDRLWAFILLLIPAAVSTVFGIIFLFLWGLVSKQAQVGSGDVGGTVGVQVVHWTAIFALFIRETLVLLLLLYEMSCVNAVSETFLPKLAWADWSNPPDSAVSTAEYKQDSESALIVTHEKRHDVTCDTDAFKSSCNCIATWSHNEQRRLSLYALIEQFPIGAKIFGYQPTRQALRLQIASTLLSILLGLLSKLFVTHVEDHGTIS